MQKQRVRTRGFFQMGDLAKAATQSARFAGDDGHLGTMLDVVDARLATTLGSDAWERYWTTNSWEFRGRSRGGVELLAVWHPTGSRSLPEFMAMAEAYERSTREDVGARISQRLFWDFLDGKFGAVVTVELQPYLYRYRYPFLQILTHGEAEGDPVVLARLGPRAMEVLRKHRDLAYAWCDERHTKRSPYLLQVESPSNCGYPYRELPDDAAFAHMLVMSQPMNMSHVVQQDDGRNEGWQSLVVEIGCHERGNAVRMFGVRDTEPLTGDIAPETKRSEKRNRRVPQPTITVVDPKHPVDYALSVTPPSYRCDTCGATGVKLWRDYQTFLNHQSLLCLKCACREQEKVRTPTEDGRSLYTDKVYYWYRTATTEPDCWHGYDPKEGPPSDAVETWSERERTDQIGWRTPAVPTEENDTFWGYTSVPQAGCEWWDRLPTFPPAPASDDRPDGGLKAAATPA